MLVHSATCRVGLVFTDRDGRKGRCSLHLPFATPADDAINFALHMADVLSGISNAVFTSYTISYDAREDTPELADLDANLHRKLVLFYRNEEGFETISIPSPKDIAFETSGSYSGIRADPLSIALAPWNTTIPVVVSTMATPEGEAFPTEYVVGGLAE